MYVCMIYMSDAGFVNNVNNVASKKEVGLHVTNLTSSTYCI